MRKSPELADDLGVDGLPFQAVGVAGGAIQRLAAFLIGKVFRMLERQVEKAAHVRAHLRVEALDQRAGGDRAGELIGRKRARIVAEQVAWKLIEQDEQAESAFSRFFPRFQL